MSNYLHFDHESKIVDLPDDVTPPVGFIKLDKYPKNSCKKCFGRGFLGVAAPVGSPYRSIVLCKCCSKYGY